MYTTTLWESLHVTFGFKCMCRVMLKDTSTGTFARERKKEEKINITLLKQNTLIVTYRQYNMYIVGIF